MKPKAAAPKTNSLIKWKCGCSQPIQSMTGYINSLKKGTTFSGKKKKFLVTILSFHLPGTGTEPEKPIPIRQPSLCQEKETAKTITIPQSILRMIMEKKYE